MPRKTQAANKRTNTKTVNKPESKRVAVGTVYKEINPLTGFTPGSDQDIAATVLLEGGASREEVVQKFSERVEPMTRNGTVKLYPNIVSGVLKKMVRNGYIVESHYKVLQPTPASKRAATRAANAAAAAKESAPTRNVRRRTVKKAKSK